MFAELGFVGTTVTEIGRRAGLSPGSGASHRHFRSKQDLLPAAIQHEVALLGMLAIAQVCPAAPLIKNPGRARRSRLKEVFEYVRQFDLLIRPTLTGRSPCPRGARRDRHCDAVGRRTAVMGGASRAHGLPYRDRWVSRLLRGPGPGIPGRVPGRIHPRRCIDDRNTPALSSLSPTLFERRNRPIVERFPLCENVLA